MKNISPFHLAIPVDDLSKAIDFYENVLDCTPGRKSDHWADYDFFGHQLVVHVDPKHNSKKHHNEVDGKSVPVPHFGVVLPWHDFDLLAKKLDDSEQIEFTISPYLRFQGLPGEQKTLFFYDPAGNALEFKSFKNIDQLFKT
ncbi:VOC family protein [Flavobacteriaceae bacterium]|nr:VOC family protein [Flavobacteriaceae bacterium]